MDTRIHFVSLNDDKHVHGKSTIPQVLEVRSYRALFVAHAPIARWSKFPTGYSYDFEIVLSLAQRISSPNLASDKGMAWC